MTDSSKFERRAFAMIRTPDQIDTIITDEGISEKAAKILESAGVKIVIA